MAAGAPQPYFPVFPARKERNWFTTSTIALIVSVVVALAFALSPIGLAQQGSGDGEPSSGATAGR